MRASPIVNEDDGVSGNTAPAASDDSASAAHDTAVVLDVLANDSDADGDPLTVTAVTAPSNGTAVINADNTITYTPDAGFTGADSFTYTVSDGTDSDTATATVTVANPPSQEIVSDDFSSGALDPLVWSFAAPPGATVASDTAGQEAFIRLETPPGDFDPYDTNNGARIVQAAADEDFQLVTRWLTSPDAQYQGQGFLVEQNAGTWLRFDVYSNGSKLFAYGGATTDGDTRTKFNVSLGTTEMPYMRLTRTGDQWTFELSADGSNWTVSRSFTEAITVTAVGLMSSSSGGAPGYIAEADYFENTAAPFVTEDGGSTNTAPAASDDSAAAAQDTAVVLDVLANDSDADGDPLTVTAVTAPSNGTAVINADNTITYTPDAGFTGADSFTYTVSDGTDSDTATATVTVSPPGNTAPAASDDSAAAAHDTAVVLDVLANDSDADGDPLTVTAVTAPSNGTAVINADNTITYTPDAGFTGADSFTYTVSDGTDSDTATATVTVASPPSQEIVSDDFSSGALDPLVWSFIAPPGATVASDTAGQEAFVRLETPPGDFNPYDTNNGARIVQAAADEDFQLVTRWLTSPDAQYQGQGFLVEQNAGTWLRFDVYSNGSGLFAYGGATTDGDTLTKFNVSLGTTEMPYMRLTRTGDQWTFELSADGSNWTVSRSFTEAITVTAVGLMSNSSGGAPGYIAEADYFENTAAPIVNEDDGVSGNTAPVASDDSAAADQDTAVVLDVLANDSDADGDPLTVTAVTAPSNGTAVINADSTITYTPDAGFTGADSFTYTVSDGTDSDTATATVTVSPPGNTAPAASDDSAATDQDTAVVLDVLANDSDARRPAHRHRPRRPTRSMPTIPSPYTPDAGFTGADSFTYTSATAPTATPQPQP